MGDNPSQFKGPDRPVEQVSWDDVQGFLERDQQRCPGLDLRLPTEAQWEYACRAGTATPFSFGETITPGAGQLQWQLSLHRRQEGTVPAGDRSGGEPARQSVGPLRDARQRLGVVRRRAAGRIPPKPSLTPWDRRMPAAYRVLRGGSWIDRARDVRSAYRYAPDPGRRYTTASVSAVPEFRSREPGKRAGGPRSAAGEQAAGGGGVTAAQPLFSSLAGMEIA